MFELKKILKPTIAAAFLVLAPLAASAATISGQISIAGSVNLAGSDFTIGDAGVIDVDLNDPGFVVVATGDFSGIPINPDAGSAVALTDIDFDIAGIIWSVGGFTFTATSFSNIDSVEGEFDAYGVVSHTGFDDTAGTLEFTTQGPSGTTVSFSATTVVPVPAAGFLLLGALGGLGLMRRRRKAA